MKRLVFGTILLAFFGMTIGCGSSFNYVPDHAFKDPLDGASIIHPVQYKEKGIEKFTIFQTVMPFDFFVEVIGDGGSWPALAKNFVGEIKKGFAFLLGMNRWGDFILQFVFFCGQEELENSKILYFNRDAGFAYTFEGDEAYYTETKKNNEERICRYNPKKFDKNEEYRAKIFDRLGKSLGDVRSFWGNYYRGRYKGRPPSFILEVTTGSKEWLSFQTTVNSKMPHTYTYGKEIRLSHLAEKDLKDVGSQNPGLNKVQRMKKYAKIPLTPLALIPTEIPIAMVTSVATNLLLSSINDDWEGYYARAKIFRFQMGPMFRQVCETYKLLIASRDKEIEKIDTWIFLNMPSDKYHEFKQYYDNMIRHGAE